MIRSKASGSRGQELDLRSFGREPHSSLSLAALSDLLYPRRCYQRSPRLRWSVLILIATFGYIQSRGKARPVGSHFPATGSFDSAGISGVSRIRYYDTRTGLPRSVPARLSSLQDTYSELDQDATILPQLVRFFIELGSDFVFVARQKKMTRGRLPGSGSPRAVAEYLRRGGPLRTTATAPTLFIIGDHAIGIETATSSAL